MNPQQAPAGKYIVEVDTTGHIVGSPTAYVEQAPKEVIVQGGIQFNANYWLMGILAVVVIAMFFSFISVKQQTVKVIQRFGKFKKLATAGLNFRIPFVDRVAGTVDLKNQQIVAQLEAKTKDNVFVTIEVATQYVIDPTKVETAFYKLDNVSSQMKAYIFDTIRAQVPTLTLDEVFAKKDDIAIAIKAELLQTMSAFGFEILTSLVTNIEPDPKVKNSMNEINAQARLREAATQKGEGDKILIVKNAEAQAESKRLEGVGIAGQRKEIIDGLKQSAEDLATATGIDKAEVMNLIMLTQYFDTLKELGTDKVLFVNPSPAGMNNLSDEIRNAMLVAGEAGKIKS